VTLHWESTSLVAERLLATLVPPDLTTPIDSPRPVIHPLATPGGTTVTDSSPADHSWHRGLSLAVSNIRVEGEPEPVNLWGGVTWSGGAAGSGGDYRQLDNNGEQRLLDLEVVESTASARLEWVTRAGRVIVREERVLAASIAHDSLERPYLALHWTSRLENASGGELGLGSPTTAGRPDAGYGGLFLRGAPELAGADVLLGERGLIADSAAMGQTARWAALRTLNATVVMRSAPTPWFVRSTPPMLCAAPFFHEEISLSAGEVLELEWDVLVTDAAWTPDEVEQALSS
jgi:hypothetical protein